MPTTRYSASTGPLPSLSVSRAATLVGPSAGRAPRTSNDSSDLPAFQSPSSASMAGLARPGTGPGLLPDFHDSSAAVTASTAVVLAGTNAFSDVGWPPQPAARSPEARSKAELIR